MRQIALVLFLCLTAGAGAQDTPPKLLLDAAHCLATAKEDWLGLGHQKPSELELGSVSDTKTYRSEELLYLVDYTGPVHAEGMVFTFLVEGKDSHRVLHLQSENQFRQSTDGSEQVELVNPPLGGIWTQEQLIAAIKKIGFNTFTVPAADVLRRADPARCDYAAATK